MYKKLLSLWENRRATDISDEFIYRLRQINTGMLTPGNLLCFQHAITHLPSNNPILEIGSFCGLSTNSIAYYLRMHALENQFITIDKWDYSFKGIAEKQLGSSNITGNEWGQFARETFIRNIQFFSRDRAPIAIEAAIPAR
jgi:hypothetical protein